MDIGYYGYYNIQYPILDIMDIISSKGDDRFCAKIKYLLRFSGSGSPKNVVPASAHHPTMLQQGSGPISYTGPEPATILYEGANRYWAKLTNPL